MQSIDELAATKKLRLTGEEKIFIGDKMKLLEDSFAVLARIDTDGTVPLISVPDTKNVMREDVSQKMISRDELLKNAPEQYDGYFQVPKVLV